MSDKPERIWAWREIDEDGHHKFWISNPKRRTGEETEYVRADKYEAMGEKVRKLTMLLDDQLGAPCEQIRHQQEIEALEAEVERLREHLSICIIWMNDREKMIPGIGRICDNARAALSADKTKEAP